ncbi:Gtr1/RagA G protein conserved region-domain-containing protein [Polychytrium aggregatum]|uniref:Gtr1/RagA G protein conserved region-domain-containing protein n=1 Tax=Polychytrium aggregatum TaxID=110093 RepID=UPI0022FDDA1C|nr:Gtr1/RagA G protein conserved region-domain-containing protein [Polychytrium aggregatum]KAI9209284.1 Gtr1/RagA G protein conserved region-domain-containing protein [Polychytrium aggregatum]
MASHYEIDSDTIRPYGSIHHDVPNDNYDLLENLDGSTPVIDSRRLYMMGLKRSGKSSILNVVFQKMAPNETLFLSSTTSIQKRRVSSIMNLSLWDFPGQIDFFDDASYDQSMFSVPGALGFVIDAQDEYNRAVHRLVETIAKIRTLNENITYEVFIHKSDGLSEDHKMETQKDIHQMIMDILTDYNIAEIPINFYLTSIYDHSIFEAFSKVIQKLIPQLPTLENILNMLCLNSGIEKAFLFDITSKIYIATDNSPVDIQSYELCSDMIDVVFDISSIYRFQPSQTSESSDAFSAEGYSIIKLNNNMVLYYREISQYLAAVCLIRAENFEKQGLIDYNFFYFKDAIIRVFQVGQAVADGSANTRR